MHLLNIELFYRYTKKNTRKIIYNPRYIESSAAQLRHEFFFRLNHAN